MFSNFRQIRENHFVSVYNHWRKPCLPVRHVKIRWSSFLSNTSLSIIPIFKCTFNSKPILTREGCDGTFSTSSFQSCFLLFELFSSTFILVKGCKVVSNDRNGQSYDKYPTNRTTRSNYFAEGSNWTNITISDLD